MATKQVPFSLEMVKKIQAGEIKGCIKTREGRPARFICELRNDTYPLAFALCSKYDKEYAYCFTIDGFSNRNKEEDDDDIIIEIEEPKQKCQFKPFDKVLCRDSSDDMWKANLFSHEAPKYAYPYYMCGGNFYKQCIPYEGNESLVGTTNKPKEE